MKPLQRLILILALLWIAVKMGLFYTGYAVSGIQIVVSLNIGFTLYVIFKALGYHYADLKGEKSDFLKDLTASLKAAALYSLIIFGFLAIYYSYINPAYIESMVDDRMLELETKMNEIGGYDAFLEQYKDELPALEGDQLTEEEYYNEVRTNYLQMMNPKMVTAVIFMGLFFINLACSAIFSGVYPKYFVNQKR